jgi:hypothetical protein
LSSLPSMPVELHCRCRPEFALERFFARARHPGHLDEAKDRAQELARLRLFASFGPLGLGPVVEVDMEQPFDVARLIGELPPA